MSASKTVYDIPGSGWTSPRWNWGYASGTGHDCALICRDQCGTPKSRSMLVEGLARAPSQSLLDRKPQNFEEVKLVLALAWQRGRWDSSDGGRGGYGDVLDAMAEASRYESGTEDERSIRLVKDMQARFHLLNPSPQKAEMMQKVCTDIESDTDAGRRQCSALVLDAMGFIEKGL